jgi:predicted nucleic acid-binding protein
MPSSTAWPTSNVESPVKSRVSRRRIGWIAPRSTIVRFVDTNILLYAISTDPDERGKAETAREVLNSRDLALSVQVIQEFYVQATRTGRPDPISHDHAVGLIQSFMRFPIQDVTMAVTLLAIATVSRYQLSYWDAAIIEAARVMKCETVLSEDLSHGQDYDGVRVVNPFAPA